MAGNSSEPNEGRATRQVKAVILVPNLDGGQSIIGIQGLGTLRFGSRVINGVAKDAGEAQSHCRLEDIEKVSKQGRWCLD